MKRLYLVLFLVISVSTGWHARVSADECGIADRLVRKVQGNESDASALQNVLQQAQRLCPSLGWAFSQEARLWAENDEGVTARRLLEKALTLSPNDNRVKKDALYIYRILGKYSTAKPYADAIIGIYNQDPEVLLDTGIVYFETGSKQTGIGYLETCAERDNRLGHCDFELGKMYLSMGRFGSAQTSFMMAQEKNGMVYTAYTIDREIKRHKRRKMALYIGLAAAVLVIAGLFFWLRHKKSKRKNVVGAPVKKEQNFAVPVSIRLEEPRQNAVEVSSGLDIASDSVIVEATAKEDAYVCLFAITTLGGVIPLNTGTVVEVFPQAGDEPLRGTLFFKVKGQIAHCFAVASKGRYRFVDHVLPHLDDILNGEISEQHPTVLPLPKDWYGQAHLKVSN